LDSGLDVLFCAVGRRAIMLSFFGLVTLGCDTFNQKDEHFAQEDGGI
jgi:hypothetical protein